MVFERDSRKRLTEKGEEFGITAEKRLSDKGNEYDVSFIWKRHSTALWNGCCKNYKVLIVNALGKGLTDI